MKNSTKKLSEFRKALVAILLFGATFSLAQAQNWMDVTDLLVKNPNFATNTNWSGGTVLPTYTAYKNGEVYQKIGKVSQLIFPVPAGKYQVTVQSFHRAKGNDNGAAYNAGTEVVSSFLFANDSTAKVKSLYSVAKSLSTVGAYSNGWPNNVQAAQAYFNLNDTVYRSAVYPVVAENQGLTIGINSTINSSGSWTCFSNFKLYVDTTGLKGSVVKLGIALIKAQNIYDTLSVWGINVAEFQESLNLYKQYGASNTDAEIKVAGDVLSGQISAGSTLITNFPILKKSIVRAEGLAASVAAGTYYANTRSLTKMDSILTVAKTVITRTMSAMATDIASTITKLDAGISGVNQSISFCFPLNNAKTVADKIGGLSTTAEYMKVTSDLVNDTIAFEVVVSDVQALNAVCKNAMTPEFLNGTSDQNPLDLTSFIVNPNIYQSSEKTAVPTGWVCNRGRSDSKDLTTLAYSDAALFNSCWSTNLNNNFGYSHYYQKIGGSTSSVILPDGLYQIKAATYSSNGNVIQLYATSDSVNFVKTNTNANRVLFDEAESIVGTTTQLLNVEVKDGKLFLGIKGIHLDAGGYTGGSNGQNWAADNFRLIYVGSSVVSVYQDRLKERVATSIGLHNKLVGYSIDDQDDLGWYLGQDSALVTSTDITAIKAAIVDLDDEIAFAKTIVANYETLSKLVTTGEALNAQLESGAIVALPNVKTVFETALINAEDRGMSTLTWDNVLTKFAPLSVGLDSSIVNLKKSVAVCYPLAKARNLAQKIGGLTTDAAYTIVVADLINNNLDPMDADMDVLELNAVCVAAMNDVVKNTASESNPFDMTSFIINPNIFQNATDSLTGAPISTKVNGWNCVSKGDNVNRTYTNAGDSYLFNYSWSGNTSYNISSGTNYRQTVGGVGEGKVALPNGTYRLAAATYSEMSSFLRLYAMSSDSVYYTSTFNGVANNWDMAQSKIDTTNSVGLIKVKDGVLTIGVKGVDATSYPGGTGRSWIADNFRLFYVSSDFSTAVNAISKENVEPEFVNVYDLAGRRVRTNVKAAEATMGLAKGFYIVGKKKVMLNY